MNHGLHTSPLPTNESVLEYRPGSAERAALDRALADLRISRVEIPVVIGGERFYTGQTSWCTAPHDHQLVLGAWHQADADLAERAAAAALEARQRWARTCWESRAAIFLRAAELLTTRHRARLTAAAMLDLGKTVHQAEIDVICELADFWRFNVHDMTHIYGQQPLSVPGHWNTLDWRPLEGFVLAVTPFNFASIAGNLPTAPALMGNTVIWKPASSAVLTAWLLFEILEEAGLPPGVINFLPGPGRTLGGVLLGHRDLAGLHFTGGTSTFQAMWKTISDDLPNKRTFPRIVGETGGKDFVLVHESADPEAVAVALLRGAFEYQGQKCSAASRAYVPESLWPQVKYKLLVDLGQVRQGPPTDFCAFVGPVIDGGAFDSISSYIQLAEADPSCTILAGGGRDAAQGWYIEPTVVQTSDPRHRLMEEEIFGPVLTIHVYPEARWAETLELVDTTSPYALTGAVFARDRAAIEQAAGHLRDAAGNFYINDKPTGAVVAQQPFGGSRASGTNDKAGSMLNLLRWVSPRTVKEQLQSPRDWRYPFLEAQ